jgi:site-specific DNA recombinase
MIKLNNKDMKNQDLRYFLYARRSIEKKDREEHVASIEDQIREMKQVGDKYGIKVLKEFTETGSASKVDNRPEFNEMIRQIQIGKANAIICWKLNRLARNFIEGGQIIDMLQRGVIKEIRTYGSVYLPTDNVLMLAVELGMANQYSRELAVDIKRGLRGKAENGYRPSIAPLGYQNSKYREKGRNEEILVDNERFPIVRKLFETAFTGQYSVKQLMNIANNELGLRTKGYKTSRHDKKIGKTNLYRILTNPFYYGWFEFPEHTGNWYKGNHQPMITKDEYDQLQIVLGRKDRPRQKTHTFAYTGLIKCANCGGSITASELHKTHKNGNTHHYIYYHCTRKGDIECREPAVRQEVLEAEILDFLGKIKIPNDFHEWAKETLKEIHQDESQDRNSIIQLREKQHQEIRARLDRLTDMRIAEEITAEEYAERKSKLEDERRTIEVSRTNLNQRIGDWMEKVENILDFSAQAYEVFTNGGIKQKRSILASLGYNHLLKDKKLIIQATNPILTVELMNNEVKLIRERIKPLKNGSVEGQIGQMYAKSPVMWRWRE